MTEEQFREVQLDPEVGAVVVGYDRSFSYRQLAIASLYIQKGRLFVGANPDAADRVGDALMPGTGPLLAAIENASGVKPTVLGKPNPLLIKGILEANELDAKRTVMIGDRLDTDMLFGINGGTSTLLVLTGVSTLDDLAQHIAEGKPAPVHVADRLGVLLSANDADGSAGARL